MSSGSHQLTPESSRPPHRDLASGALIGLIPDQEALRASAHGCHHVLLSFAGY